MRNKPNLHKQSEKSRLRKASWRARRQKGCGSSIGLAGIALVAAVATVGVVAKKKED